MCALSGTFSQGGASKEIVALPGVFEMDFSETVVTVNHDGRGGTAPDPLVWDQGGRREGAQD